MIFLSLSAAMLLSATPAEPVQAADGFVVCSTAPTRPGSNRVALVNISYGDEARVVALSEEYRDWLRSDATVAKDIAASGIDPRLVLAQMTIECSWAKEQSAAEGIAERSAKRLRADGIKVLPSNWTPKAGSASN